MMPARRSREAGAVYISSVLMLVLLGGLGMAYLSVSVRNSYAVQHAVERERAAQIAESGLDLAFAELRASADFAGDGVGTVEGELDGGSFSVTVSPPFAGVGRYEVQAVGKFREQREGLFLLLEVGDDSVGEALFANECIVAKGAVFTDGWDSTQGSYASQATQLDQTTGAIRGSDHGDLVSNGLVDLGGGTTVHGDAEPGPGTSVSGGEFVVTGSRAPASQRRDVPPVVYAPPSSAGPALDPGTERLVLKSGSHRFTHLKTTSSIVVKGDVTLYVDGPISLTDGAMIKVSVGARLRLVHGSGSVFIGGKGIRNRSEDPAAFAFESATTDEVTLATLKPIHGTLRAPQAPVLMCAGTEIFGGTVAGSATLEGEVRLHYDVALKRGEASEQEGVCIEPLVFMRRLPKDDS